MPTLTSPSTERHVGRAIPAFRFPVRRSMPSHQLIPVDESLVAQALRQPVMVLSSPAYASGMQPRVLPPPPRNEAPSSSAVPAVVPSSASKDEFDAASVLMSLAPGYSSSTPTTSDRTSLLHSSSRSAFRPVSQVSLYGEYRSHHPSLSLTVSSSHDDWTQQQQQRQQPMSASADFEEQADASALHHHQRMQLSNHTHTAVKQITPSVSPHPAEQLHLYNGDWVHATTSLYCSEDEDVLSPLHCFMRKYCVEAFTATPDDIVAPRSSKSHCAMPGQVGIRCLFCKHRDVKAERAACFPSSLKNIYHSIETWQRRHSIVCQDIPDWVKNNMIDLLTSNRVRAGGRRQYWEDSAKRLGMVDTVHGVRFCRAPGELEVLSMASPSDNSQVSSSPLLLCSTVASNAPPPRPIVREEDKEIVTDFLYLLLDQMETCQFTEEDRSGGRSKIKGYSVGYPGMQCKHCQGKAGFGRYFPATLEALALANSDRNVYNHLQKCRKTPEHVKTELAAGFTTNRRGQSKNKRGNRKFFFKRIWDRIHEKST